MIFCWSPLQVALQHPQDPSCTLRAHGAPSAKPQTPRGGDAARPGRSPAWRISILSQVQSASRNPQRSCLYMFVNPHRPPPGVWGKCLQMPGASGWSSRVMESATRCSSCSCSEAICRSRSSGTSFGFWYSLKAIRASLLGARASLLGARSY